MENALSVSVTMNPGAIMWVAWVGSRKLHLRQPSSNWWRFAVHDNKNPAME